MIKLSEALLTARQALLDQPDAKIGGYQPPEPSIHSDPRMNLTIRDVSPYNPKSWTKDCKEAPSLVHSKV